MNYQSAHLVASKATNFETEMEIGVENTPQKANIFGTFINKPHSNDSAPPAAQLTVNKRVDCSDMMESTTFDSNTDQLEHPDTPPAKRFQRVRNPFEAAMVDRLHLPLIESPSLFQRRTKPQMSSTQFEWTIEEVASLRPADVEPHETQFIESPNPEFEAKAQSAISSFFKDHRIVPSPDDCPLRKQRIILSELNGNTPMSKPGRRIRDCGTQTELTLPPILPAELELALRPYLQPELAGSGFELSRRFNAELYFNRGRGEENDEEISLRRKLFDLNNVILLGENSPMSKPNSGAENVKDMSMRRKLFVLPLDERPSTSTKYDPCSPMLLRQMQRATIAGHLSDSPSEMSPVLRRTTVSQHNSSERKRKAFMPQGGDQNGEELSPIIPPKRIYSSRPSRLLYPSDTSTVSDHTFGNISSLTSGDTGHTADQGSSPLLQLEAAETFIDNKLNSNASIAVAVRSRSELTSAEPQLIGIAIHNDTTEIFTDDDDMLQLSTRSLNCSTQSETPRVKRLSANRKNLSLSFCYEESSDDDEMEQDRMPAISALELKKFFMTSGQTAEMERDVGLSQPQQIEGSVVSAAQKSSHDSSAFYRTDSGFNEMTSSSSSSSAPWPGIDANIVSIADDKEFGSEKFVNKKRNMGCSSTPSKHNQLRLSIDVEDDD